VQAFVVACGQVRLEGASAVDALSRAER
jgi:hypothetical protein